MAKRFVVWGSVLAGLSVALGAFGAHVLEARLTEDMLETFQTGVDYHMMHALGLILVGILSKVLPSSSPLKWAGWAMILGTIIFSGSLYVLSLTGVTVLGAITPIGGVLFIAAWLLVAIAASRYMKEG